MGPLQYMAVAFEPEQFKARILPELRQLSAKGIVRVVDLLVVSRRDDGHAEGLELYEVLSGEDTRFASTAPEDASQWFTQDDIDMVGSALPPDGRVALILFEHLWAKPLDDAVNALNASMSGSDVRIDTAEIERLLVLGAETEATRNILG